MKVSLKTQIVGILLIVAVLVVTGQFGQGCATHWGFRVQHKLTPSPGAHCERYGFLRRFF